MEPQERVHLHQVIKQLDTQLNTYHELLERERAMTRRYPLGGVGKSHALIRQKSQYSSSFLN